LAAEISALRVRVEGLERRKAARAKNHATLPSFLAPRGLAS
jgi:hypothetical protein